MEAKTEKKTHIALRENQVVLVYLFGSEAKGDAHRESDVDIGVLFSSDVNPKAYLKKEGCLIALFGELYPGREINIVNLNISSPLLKQSVVLEGNLIYSQDEISRISFENKALSDYEEYLRLNRIYNFSLKTKLRSL